MKIRHIFFGCLMLAGLIISPVMGMDYLISPMNGKELNLTDNFQNYSFMAVGHVYGAHSSPLYPAGTFISNIDWINKQDPSFIVLLGDSYHSCDNIYVDNFKNTVCSRLNVPLFNAVGNHDENNLSVYKENFGETYYSFRKNTELFIILDTISADGEIQNEQLDFLLKNLNDAVSSDNVENIFIFSHYLIWSADDDRFNVVYNHQNSNSWDKNNLSFSQNVMPKINELSLKKNVYLISGDIGTEWSLPVFYYNDSEHHITYIACGIYDLERDTITKFSISNDSDVSINLISALSPISKGK